MATVGRDENLIALVAGVKVRYDYRISKLQSGADHCSLKGFEIVEVLLSGFCRSWFKALRFRFVN